MRAADSLLASLGDRAFRDGLARIDDAIANGDNDADPGSLGLLILRRDPAYSARADQPTAEKCYGHED